MMKRLTAIALTSALIGATVLMMIQPTLATHHTKRDIRCRYGNLDGKTQVWSATEVEKTIRCAARRWPVDLSTVFYILERESGLSGYKAVNPTSGACGLFQHIPTYWPGRVTKHNRGAPAVNVAPSCFNGRSNVLVSIRMMSNGGYGPWGG